jgi:diguanylate cyclase (GGDEF)-like protein/PAS domain S-box-containing protein
MGFNKDIELAVKKIQELEESIKGYVLREKQYDSILNNVKEVIFQTDATGLWTYLNRPWTEITGFSLEESIGILFLNFVHPDDRELNNQRFIPLIQRQKDYCRHIIRYLTKDEGFRWIEVYARLTLDSEDNIIGTSGTLNDVTDRILMENELRQHKEHLEELVKERTKELKDINSKLEYLATHDSLTDIPNRYYLFNALQDAIDNANNIGTPSSLLFIDLDNFKVINDTYGHSVGDELLREMARIATNFLDCLTCCSQKGTMIARLGGDEFAILLSECIIEQSENIAEKLRQEIEQMELKLSTGIVTSVTTSIGIVKIDGSLSPQELLAYADTALYSAKDNGKNRIELIESSAEKNILSQTTYMVNLIKSALKENRFTLHYQPVYKLDNSILHYEALIRLLDEDNNTISPNAFIPIAERFGLMSQIDKWVVQEVIKLLNKRFDLHVFINISGISLGDKALLQFIEESIRNSNIDPTMVGFEITETTAIKELSQSGKWIRKLKQLGCKFALDDFGVGFSSFSYLNDLPIDYLKIDGSFVRDLHHGNQKRAIVQAINAVAHALGKQTIAEFVENREILETLRELNVDCGQGYYLGKPQPLSLK